MKKKTKCCWGNFGDHQKKDPSVRCRFGRANKLRDIQAGPRFRMVKKKDKLRTTIETILHRTRGANVGPRFRGIMCGMGKHLSKLKRYGFTAKVQKTMEE